MESAMERMIMNAQREAAHQMAMPEPRESLGDLLGDLMTQSTGLVKGEVALAKAELRDKARLYSSAALIIAVGGAFGLLAAMALLAAGIIALATYTGLATSALIFGAALGAPATLLFKRGLRNFKRHSS
jgi:Putative Actinobacterial Holin-X, holin superfamily III